MSIVPRALLETLHGGLWHTTCFDRFASILRADAILPEPSGLAEAARWSTRLGRDGWPFVRLLGGVSLFDFEGFDADAYEAQCPMSNWQEFVPFRASWGQSVWIKIDRSKLGEGYISAVDLLQRWKDDGAYRHRLMPFIEAAHIGPLMGSAFEYAFIVGADIPTPKIIWPRLQDQ